MNTTATLERLDAIQLELNGVEARMTIPTLLPALQDALEDEWEHLMCELEMLTELLANELEDTRPGCDQCAGCTYCEESAPGYDPADEI